MKENVKIQNEKNKIGGCNYLNKNCWLIKNLNYSPYKRCQYCEFKFRDCLFLQYQVVSIFLILLSFSLFLIIEKRLSSLTVVTVFILIIAYGYFFNRSTKKIIASNFSLKQAKNALKELTDNLEDKVDEQTDDLRKINKDLKLKNQLNQELLNIKSDFLHIVNHQLNTPLSVMRNAYSMLEEKNIDYKKGMGYLKGGLTRMSETIKDFWDAFELEGQKMELEPKETDISEIINSQVEEKKQMPKAREKGIEIKINRPNFTIPKVFCDPKKIVHVISNLLDNAVYYTLKGSVSVSYEKPNKNYLKIKVADSGAGISKQDQKNLFKKFSRGKETEDMRPDGSGLGLYIAQRIVDGHNGELKLEKSDVGQGTTFSFTVPIYTGQKEIVFSKEKKRAEEVFARSKQENKNNLNSVNSSNFKNIDKTTTSSSGGKAPARPKILMVEDESNLIDMYKDYLIKNGFNFYNTKDIKEGLVIAKTERIDAILLDIVIPKDMPDGSVYTMAQQGWDFLKQAKQDPKIKNIPIIVWTNLNSEDDKKKAKDLGADGFIFKGAMEPKKLVEEVRNIINKK